MIYARILHLDCSNKSLMCEIASENPFTNQNVFRDDDSLLLIMSKETLRQASMPKEQSYSFECWNSIEFLKFNGIVHMTGPKHEDGLKASIDACKA